MCHIYQFIYIFVVCSAVPAKDFIQNKDLSNIYLFVCLFEASFQPLMIFNGIKIAQNYIGERQRTLQNNEQKNKKIRKMKGLFYFTYYCWPMGQQGQIQGEGESQFIPYTFLCRFWFFIMSLIHIKNKKESLLFPQTVSLRCLNINVANLFYIFIRNNKYVV